jgi:hypothetical protein
MASPLPHVDIAELVPGELFASPPIGWQMERCGTLTDEADPTIRARFALSSAAGLKMLTLHVDGDDRGRLMARVIDESRPCMVRIRK